MFVCIFDCQSDSVDAACSAALACMQCGKVFSSEVALEQHRWLHRVREMQKKTGADADKSTQDKEKTTGHPSGNASVIVQAAHVPRSSSRAYEVMRRSVGQALGVYSNGNKAQPAISKRVLLPPRDRIGELYGKYESMFTKEKQEESNRKQCRASTDTGRYCNRFVYSFCS